MIDFDRALTSQEVAEVLSVSQKMVLKLCAINPAAGGIPSYKFGRCVRVKESDLQKWLENQKRWQE